MWSADPEVQIEPRAPQFCGWCINHHTAPIKILEMPCCCPRLELFYTSIFLIADQPLTPLTTTRQQVEFERIYLGSVKIVQCENSAVL